MSDEMIDINAKPTYAASLQLACGLTAIVTVTNGSILFDTQDAEGEPRTATLTDSEANEVASMLSAADRVLTRERLNRKGF